MTTNPFYFGIPALLIFNLLGYIAKKIAFRRLASAQVDALTLALRQERQRYVYGMLGLLAAFLIFRYSIPSFTNPIFVTYLAASAVLMLTVEWGAWKVVKQLDFADSFASRYAVWRALTLAGILSFFLVMAVTPLYQVPSES